MFLRIPTEQLTFLTLYLNLSLTEQVYVVLKFRLRGSHTVRLLDKDCFTIK